MPTPSSQSMVMRLFLEIKAAEKAMALRIDEALAIENRLNKRMELLQQAEQNLKGMLQSAREQVEVARPLLRPLPQITQAAREALESATTAVRGGVDRAINGATEASQRKLDEHAQSLLSDLDSAAQLFGKELAERLETSQKQADALAGMLHRRLEAAREQYVLMESAVEERLRQVMGRMYSRLDNLDVTRGSVGAVERAPDVEPIRAVPPLPAELEKLEKASQLLTEHRAVVKSVPLSSEPKILGRAPEYLRFGERRWRGQLVGDCAIELTVSAA